MALCETCDNFSQILLGGADETNKGIYHLSRRNQYLVNAREVVPRAERCKLCRFLMNVILTSVKGITWERAEELLPRMAEWLAPEPIYVKSCNDPMRGHPNFEDGELLTGFNLEVPVVEGGPSLVLDRLELDVYAVEHSPAALSYEIGSRRPVAKSDSPEAFELLNNAISTCVKTHPHCVQTISGTVIDESVSPRLPTRVLDIGTSGDSIVRLKVTTASDYGHYAALSHCWGPREKRPLSTTKDNLVQHTIEIPFQKFPNTFQDSIIVARKCGLGYLWIDSLCIVQDDREDWYRESQRMGLVYQHARITIAASHAHDATEGLFFERNKLGWEIEVPYINQNGQRDGFIFIHPKGIEDHWAVDQGPLSKRAWITQEWLLSCRTIFYTRSRLIWNCRSLEGDLETKRIVRQRHFRGLTANVYKEWESVVSHYSKRDLTYATDRLVALQGIANELQKAQPDDCYAHGMWTSGLPRHLLWRGTGELTPAPSELHIPSWSWASKIGPVTLTTTVPAELYLKKNGLGSTVECKNIHLEGNDDEVLRLNAKIVSLRLAVRPFGVELRSPFPAVMFMGRSIEAENPTLDWIKNEVLRHRMKLHFWTQHAPTHCFISDISSGEVIGCAHLDEGKTQYEKEKDKTVVGALITSHYARSGIEALNSEGIYEQLTEHILILKPLEDGISGQLFKRVGEGVVFINGSQSFLEKHHVETVRIK